MRSIPTDGIRRLGPVHLVPMSFRVLDHGQPRYSSFTPPTTRNVDVGQ
jgi:hypothetical protein